MDPPSGGKGNVNNLIRRSILLAGCLGFEGLKAEACTGYAQVAFETIGFSSSTDYYKDFEYEGEKVVAGIRGSPAFVLSEEVSRIA